VEEAVCDAVFRYQLQQPLADAPRPLCYDVARQGRDPDDAFLGRLRAFASDVQPLSHCRVSMRDGVVDRISGVRGVIVQVTRLSWVHSPAVDVIGGYDLTPRHAASFRYHVKHEGATGPSRPPTSSGGRDPAPPLTRRRGGQRSPLIPARGTGGAWQRPRRSPEAAPQRHRATRDASRSGCHRIAGTTPSTSEIDARGAHQRLVQDTGRDRVLFGAVAPGGPHRFRCMTSSLGYLSRSKAMRSRSQTPPDGHGLLHHSR
jgi:hypothetical protein